jgi:hypothetical protein
VLSGNLRETATAPPGHSTNPGAARTDCPRAHTLKGRPPQGRTRPRAHASAPRAQDYLVAQGGTRAAVLDGRVQGDRRVCFTQDAVDWLDLPEVPAAAARAAARLTAQLTGDPAAVVAVAPPPDADGGAVRDSAA